MNRFIMSFFFAVKGLVAALRNQLIIKVQLVIAVLVVISGFYFHISSVDWCIVLITIGFVISLELVNTALESLVDLVTKERPPLAGKVKDIAAGAVLVASMTAAIIGIIIFGKYIFA